MSLQLATTVHTLLFQRHYIDITWQNRHSQLMTTTKRVL